MSSAPHVIVSLVEALLEEHCPLGKRATLEALSSVREGEAAHAAWSLLALAMASPDEARANTILGLAQALEPRIRLEASGEVSERVRRSLRTQDRATRGEAPASDESSAVPASSLLGGLQRRA